MIALDTILDAEPRQLSIDELLAEIEAENRDMAPQVIAVQGPSGSGSTSSVATESPEIGPEPHNGFEPGASIGHVDLADFRGVYVGPGRRPGIALVRVMAGWTCEPPAWPVSIPIAKLVEVT